MYVRISIGRASRRRGEWPDEAATYSFGRRSYVPSEGLRRVSTIIVLSSKCLLFYRGVAALHSLNKNVVHRDIKSMNFLGLLFVFSLCLCNLTCAVDSQLNAKLADLELGGAGAYDPQASAALPADDILVNWMAPEVLQGEQYTQASDIYSLALVLWEIVSGAIPYADVKATSGKAKTKNLIRMKVLAGHRPTIPLTCPVFYGRLLEAGWATNTAARISAHGTVLVLLAHILR